MKITFAFIIFFTALYGAQSNNLEDEGEREAKMLMASFKINFDSTNTEPKMNGTKKQNYSNNTIDDNNWWVKRFDFNDEKLKRNSTTGLKYGKNGSGKGRKHPKKNARQMDLEIQDLSRKFFYPASEPLLNSQGRPLTYFKDTTSIPIMFRKVIPPRGTKLPLLNFEFDQDNKKCRCLCKL